jgi:hypothetical protein
VLGPFGASAPRDMVVARGSQNRQRFLRDDLAKPVRIPPSPQMPPPVALARADLPQSRARFAARGRGRSSLTAWARPERASL